MDKRGSRILLGCAIGALITITLFIIVLRFTQPTCELIFVDPDQLRSVALDSWSKNKPIRSHDKSMLLKMAAYLEYNLQTTGRPTLSETRVTQPPSQQLMPTPQAVPINAVLPAVGHLGVPTMRLAPVQQTNLSNVQLQQTNQSSANNNNNNNLPSSSLQHKEKRFLPLDFDDLEVKKVSENRYKYTLSFNCSTMSMIFVRRPERVHVEQVSVELKLASKRKTSCELQLPAQGVFGVDTHVGLAHYYCDRPLRYSCYHYSSKNPNQAGLLLAELHIHSLEFEVGSNSSGSGHSNHRSHEFSSPRKECDLPPGGIS